MGKGATVFMGSFQIAVGRDGQLTLPANFAQALSGRDLLLECIAGVDGLPAIMAVPAQTAAQQGAATGGRCRVGPHGETIVDPDLLRRVYIGDAAVVEGMGEYLILHRAAKR